jgi:hypothetical protein
VTITSTYFGQNFNHFLVTPHEKKAAVDVFTYICYALEELYKLGYVHRSICPEKVCLTYEPLEVHLAGYGTATLK